MRNYKLIIAFFCFIQSLSLLTFGNGISNQTIKQKLDSIHSYHWDEENLKWNLSSRVKFTYDTHGNIMQELNYEWNEGKKQWVQRWKITFSYNENRHLSQRLYYEWSNTIGDWVEDEKNEYFYNDKGYLFQNLHYHKNKSNNQWDINWEKNFVYDENGNKVQQLFNGTKTEFTLDDNENVAQELLHIWDESEKLWVYRRKVENQFDSNGNLILEQRFLWDKDNNQWLNDSKSEYTYDQYNNLKNNIYYTWDKSNQWNAIWNDEYTYNNTYSINELMLPYYYTENSSINFFNHMKISEFSFEKNSTAEWVNNYKTKLHYSETNLTHIINKEDNEYKVYPNPTNGILNFSFKEWSTTLNFELFDLQGQKIISKNIFKGEPLDLSGLKPGIYLYTIQTRGKRHKGKLIKE